MIYKVMCDLSRTIKIAAETRVRGGLGPRSPCRSPTSNPRFRGYATPKSGAGFLSG